MIEPQNGMDRVYPGIVINSKNSIVWKIDPAITYPTVGDVITRWELTDDENNIITLGSPDTVDVRNTSTGIVLTMDASISIPSTIPASLEGVTYYISYYADWNNEEKQSTEEVLVFEPDATDYGLKNSVGLADGAIPLSGVIETTSVQDVKVKIYSPDDVFITEITISPDNNTPERLAFNSNFNLNNVWQMSDGINVTIVYNPTVDTVTKTYTIPGDATPKPYLEGQSFQIEFVASLDPFIAQWYLVDDTYIGSSQCWIINNTYSSVMHEMQIAIERPMVQVGLRESALEGPDYLQFMKMGRDYFNALQQTTNFTMAKADGHMRRMWLICSQYEAMQSRQLEEALKAFDFSGQSTTLMIDLAPAYETMKVGFEQQIDAVVRPYKRQLAIKQIHGGDGSDAQIKRGKAVTRLGLTYSRVGAAGYRLHEAYTTSYLRPKIVMY